MFDPDVFEQRDKFCREVAAVDSDYLQDNAAALFVITNELSRSLVLEFRIIQQIRRLDVSNPGEVDNFLWELEDYVQRAVYDNERTRCSLIARAWHRQAAPMAFGDSAQRDAAAELESLIQLFMSADFEFIDEVEQSVREALDVVRSIKSHLDAGDEAAARDEQAGFVTRYEAELARLKTTLRQLTGTAMALTDKL